MIERGLNMKYFIITPTKNEENNLPNLIQFIEVQTIKPVLWVIVDESSDNTVEMIKGLTEKYRWVKSIFLKNKEGYLGINYGIACKSGFDFAIEYCKQQGIEYEYLGLVDADATIEKDLFEKLMVEFEKDPELGIASGVERWNISGKLVDVNMNEDLPMGPARMWRKRCFEETDGYQAVTATDSVSNAKAKIKGWKTKQFRHLTVITRRTATAGGYWKGFAQNGRDSYFLNYHPLIIILKALKYFFNKPHYHGIALLFGYFSCVVCNKSKISDHELQYYFRHTKTREIFRNHFDMLKDKLKRER